MLTSSFRPIHQRQRHGNLRRPAHRSPQWIARSRPVSSSPTLRRRQRRGAPPTRYHRNHQHGRRRRQSGPGQPLSSPAGAGEVTFESATADNTATVANNDYQPASLTGQTIPQGGSTYLFTVPVIGDLTNEPNETFFVNVTKTEFPESFLSDTSRPERVSDHDPVLAYITLPNNPLNDITGPLHVQGVTVANAARAFQGKPYVSTPGPLANGATANISVRYLNPGNVLSQPTCRALQGSF